MSWKLDQKTPQSPTHASCNTCLLIFNFIKKSIGWIVSQLPSCSPAGSRRTTRGELHSKPTFRKLALTESHDWLHRPDPNQPPLTQWKCLAREKNRKLSAERRSKVTASQSAALCSFRNRYSYPTPLSFKVAAWDERLHRKHLVLCAGMGLRDRLVSIMRWNQFSDQSIAKPNREIICQSDWEAAFPKRIPMDALFYGK